MKKAAIVTLKVLGLITVLGLLLYIGAYVYLLYKLTTVWCTIYTGDMTPEQIEYCEPYKNP